jgi:hypothetical protein
MSKFLTIPRFWGPLLTVSFTVVYYAIILYFGWSITFSWLWLFMAAGIFISGLRAGMLCAAFIVAFTLYAIPMDTSRIIQLAISTPAAAVLVGWQTRELRLALSRVQAEGDRAREALAQAEKNQAKADLVDSVNGNIEKLRTVLKILDDLLMGWDVLDNDRRRGLIIDVRAQLATLLLLVFGWHKIAEEKRYAEGEMKK